VVRPDAVTAAVVEEASNAGNQRKLAACAEAARRHLFVVLTFESADNALWALVNILDGKTGFPPLPVLPEAITTVWAAHLSGGVFVTPPNPWQTFTPTRELRERYAI
jgi:hypothetical protein